MAEPTRFLLIRHAMYDGLGTRLAGRAPGHSLNAEGRAQAQSLCERVIRTGSRIEAVYSSPLERAVETAEPLALRLGVPIRRLPAFLELDFGDWTGKTVGELADLPAWRRFNAYRGGQRAPGGELMAEAAARAVFGLEQLRLEHPGGTVAVVSHADIIRAALAQLLGMPLDFVLRLEVAPASISTVEVGDWGPRVLTVNAV